MPKTHEIPAGAPIWMDLSTSDIDRARTFYGALFGWSVNAGLAEFGGYSVATLNGDRVAGMMPKWEDSEVEAMPDAWSVYLHTTDPIATAAAVTAHGGEVVLEAMEIADFGAMSVFIDPSGAFFGTWRPNLHTGYQVFGEPGAPAWFELTTRDIDAASAFYAAVFDLTVSEANNGTPGYRTLTIDGEEKAGLMDGRDVLPEGVPSNWLIYWGVEDAGVTATQAVELGGNILAPPIDTPFGRFVLLADPMGAVFAVIGVGDWGDERS